MEFARGGAGVAFRKRKQRDGHGKKRAKRLRGVLDSTVMVRHVQGITAQHLSAFFQNYGDVAQVRLVEEQAYALVTFQAKEIAEGVIAAMGAKEGVTIDSLHRKVQVSWAASGLPTEADSGSCRQPDSYKQKKHKKKHYTQPGLRRRCKSRLFVSAVASAVASAGAVVEGHAPRPPAQKDRLADREVIAYDDWL